jgi:hypothetical protein
VEKPPPSGGQKGGEASPGCLTAHFWEIGGRRRLLLHWVRELNKRFKTIERERANDER